MAALGFDPVRFGAFLVLMAELALIASPVGMNLYVVQGIGGGSSIRDVILGSLPFAGAPLTHDRHPDVFSRDGAMAAGMSMMASWRSER
ncbi:MAG: TRAP transporter large permease subunit [Pseudomonadota bacterium]